MGRNENDQKGTVIDLLRTEHDGFQIDRRIGWRWGNRRVGICREIIFGTIRGGWHVCGCLGLWSSGGIGLRAHTVCHSKAVARLLNRVREGRYGGGLCIICFGRVICRVFVDKLGVFVNDWMGK